MIKKLLLLLVLGLPLQSQAQELRRDELVGTWRSWARFEATVLVNDTVPVFRQRTCVGRFEISVLDRGALSRLVTQPLDSLFAYARKGSRARQVRGTDICADSSLSRGEVRGASRADTITVVGVLAFEDHAVSVDDERYDIALDFAPSDTAASIRRRYHRHPDGVLSGSFECERLGRLIVHRAFRGFEQERPCQVHATLVPAAEPVRIPPTAAVALAAADSVISFELQYAQTMDTLLWTRARPQASTLMAYLRSARFPRSSQELELLDFLRVVAAFTDGSAADRHMFPQGYRLEPRSQANRVAEADRKRGMLRRLSEAVHF